jgi:broad specificity phosphatase PhoE
VRYVEHRRHTMRTRPGKHLSQAGVTLARRVGEGLGPFDRVITSDKARAFETAIAMGFAVDEQRDALGTMGDAVDAEVDWQEGFPAWSRALGRGRAAARYCREQADLLAEIAAALPEGGRALVISHGGVIEAGAVGALPDGEHTVWGTYLDYCEGVLLTYDGGRCVAVSVLRLPPGLTPGL